MKGKEDHDKALQINDIEEKADDTEDDDDVILDDYSHRGRRPSRRFGKRRRPGLKRPRKGWLVFFFTTKQSFINKRVYCWFLDS